MFCFDVGSRILRPGYDPECSASPCDSGLSARVNTSFPSATSLIDKESAGGEITWCSYFPLEVCVSLINNSLCWPSSFNDCIWPSLSENVVGPVHAQKKSADGFGDAAGYLELQPHRRCIWRGMQYLWGSSLKSLDSHSQHMYLQIRIELIIKRVLVHWLLGKAVLGTDCLLVLPQFWPV